MGRSGTWTGILSLGMLGWQRREGNESLLFVENPMSLEKLSTTLTRDVAQLREEGRAIWPYEIDYQIKSRLNRWIYKRLHAANQ